MEINSNNIFEGAKFGDKFLTRDGRIAIFKFIIPNTSMVRVSIMHNTEEWDYNVFLDGTTTDKELKNEHYMWNVVSRYQEPVDENKLDKLALNYKAINKQEHSIQYCAGLYKGFKVGYRKAKKE